VQAGAGRIGEHVEDINFGRQLLVPLGKGMAIGDSLAGVPGSKGFVCLPSGLPFRFDQIEWILLARTRHQGVNILEIERRSNADLLPREIKARGPQSRRTAATSDSAKYRRRVPSQMRGPWLNMDNPG